MSETKGDYTKVQDHQASVNLQSRILDGRLGTTVIIDGKEVYITDKLKYEYRNIKHPEYSNADRQAYVNLQKQYDEMCELYDIDEKIDILIIQHKLESSVESYVQILNGEWEGWENFPSQMVKHHKLLEF